MKEAILLNISKMSQYVTAENHVPVYSEDEIEKAVNDGAITLFSVENVSAFERNLQKAIHDCEGSNDPALLAEIEKAKKDLSKLVKVKKQDKRGRMVTYYVKSNQAGAGATQKEGSNMGKESSAKMKDTGLGVHVPDKMTHKGLGELSHVRDEEGEGGNHKHYYKDKDGSEVHFKSDTLIEHGMAEKKASGTANPYKLDADDKQSARTLAAELASGKDMDSAIKSVFGSADEFKDKDRLEAIKKFAKNSAASPATKKAVKVKETKDKVDHKALGEILLNDFSDLKKHLPKYTDGKKFDQHALVADYPGDKLTKLAAEIKNKMKKVKETNPNKAAFYDDWTTEDLQEDFENTDYKIKMDETGDAKKHYGQQLAAVKSALASRGVKVKHNDLSIGENLVDQIMYKKFGKDQIEKFKKSHLAKIDKIIENWSKDGHDNIHDTKESMIKTYLASVTNKGFFDKKKDK